MIQQIDSQAIQLIIMQILAVMVNTYIAFTSKGENIYIATVLFNFLNMVLYFLNGDMTTVYSLIFQMAGNNISDAAYQKQSETCLSLSSMGTRCCMLGSNAGITVLQMMKVRTVSKHEYIGSFAPA